MIHPSQPSAEAMFKRFHGFGPLRREILRYPRIIPEVLVQLGELGGLIYRSDKWTPGTVRTYIHFMEDPPRLACNPPGNQLYIVGGSYRVTAKGLEG